MGVATAFGRKLVEGIIKEMCCRCVYGVSTVGRVA